MSQQQFNWTKLLLDAARHSPQALEFVRAARDDPHIDGWRAYPPPRSGSVNATRDAAKELDELIFKNGLQYHIMFQCTPDSKVKFDMLLDALYKFCPHWRFHPNSEYRWTVITNGVVNRAELRERIDAEPRTQGGFLYERIDALVNQEAYVILKVMCSDLYLIDDFSELTRFR